MLPIVLVIAMWGNQWRGKTVLFQCDNAAIVATIKSGWCTNKHAMHLLRSLYFFQAAYQVRPLTEHIKGTHNELADAISGNNHQNFLSMLSYTQKVPDAVLHLQLRQALVDHQLTGHCKLGETCLQIFYQRTSRFNLPNMQQCTKQIRDILQRCFPATPSSFRVYTYTVLLCSYLGKRQPEAQFNNGLFIYQLCNFCTLQRVPVIHFFHHCRRLQYTVHGIMRCEAEKGDNKKERLPVGRGLP